MKECEEKSIRPQTYGSNGARTRCLWGMDFLRKIGKKEGDSVVKVSNNEQTKAVVKSASRPQYGYER